MRLWSRLPVIVRAIVAGGVVATAGTLPWALLVLANQKVLPAVPWAMLPAAFGLYLFWRYFNGEGWPRATSEARRVSMRANTVSPDAWGGALFAGILGLVALMPFTVMVSRLVRLPAESQPINTPEAMPAATVLTLLLMASLVAGVVEEAAFRGYMQGPVERRHGFVAAIVASGAVFGAAHYWHHPAAVQPMLPFYVAVAAIYGGLAWATNSILPSIVLHTAGDVFSLTRLWLTGKPEWDLATQPPPLVWDAGPDAAFWGALAALIVLGGAAVWAYVSLADSVRRERGPMPSASMPA